MSEKNTTERYMSSKNVMIRISDDDHLKLKLYSVKTGVSMQAIFSEFLAKLLKNCK